MDKSMANLPDEILGHIFEYSEFGASFRSIIRVSKIWHRVAFDIKRIVVRATPIVKKLGLNSILSRFPLLEDLILEPSSRNLEYGPDLIHEIAKHFSGHPTLRRISCGSDFIIPGSLSGCSMLENIQLGFLHTWGTSAEDLADTEDGMLDEYEDAEGVEAVTEQESAQIRESTSAFRRNLAAILKRGKRLKVLDIESATFWYRPSKATQRRESIDGGWDGLAGHGLKVLGLKNFSGWSLQNFTTWLGTSPTVAFPDLEELKLDADYLNLPPAFFRNLGLGCPALKRLHVKYANLAPHHLFDIAEYLNGLSLLSIGKSEFWFYPAAGHQEEAGLEFGQDDEILEMDGEVSQRMVVYSDVVRFLTTHLKSLASLHFNQNTLHAISENSTMPLPPRPLSFPDVSKHVALRALKVFDVTDKRMTSDQFMGLVALFPNLCSLRIDVPMLEDIRVGDAIMAPESWSFLHDHLPQLETLELRCAKPKRKASAPDPLAPNPSPASMALGVKPLAIVGQGIRAPTLDKEFNIQDGSVANEDDEEEEVFAEDIVGEEDMLEEDDFEETLSLEEPELEKAVMGKITSLSLWSSHPSSLPGLLGINSSTLTHLSLNYIPNSATMLHSHNGTIPVLPKLRSLIIKTLTHAAVFDAMYLLDAVLGEQGCPSLRFLTIEALHRSPLPPVNSEELASVAMRTPGLVQLKLNNLKVSADFLGRIRRQWTKLERVELVGRFGGVGTVVDRKWVEDSVAGFSSFIEGKPGLKVVRIHVEGVDVEPSDALDLPGGVNVGAKPIPVPSDEPERSWKQMYRNIINQRVSDMSGYRRFSEWIAARWTSLEEVTMTGPLSGFS
ncbi:hypothetical protein HDU97_004931 [Phlyctochytrium planicorne]|nr:hypothetical protein HDU97_004931 [Phlyctochytrium planicorne]